MYANWFHMHFFQVLMLYFLKLLQLKEELANFGPEFFEEIEDLKYNYREAVQKNVELEDKLHRLSRQYGFSANFGDSSQVTVTRHSSHKQ